MRNMAFSITTRQMYDETKDVTRRLGWWGLKPGDIVMAVEKGMGLKKGEKVRKIYPILIVSCRREPLNKISAEDVVREGFPELSQMDFVEMFSRAHENVSRTIIVNRIEFKKTSCRHTFDEKTPAHCVFCGQVLEEFPF